MAVRHTKGDLSDAQKNTKYPLNAKNPQQPTVKEKRKSGHILRKTSNSPNSPTNVIPDELVNFDRLPDAAYVRQPVVEGLYACSSATVWRHVERGVIPAPRKLSAGISGWNVGDLRRNLANA